MNFSYQVYEDVSVSQQRRGGGGYLPQESYENADQFRHPGLDQGLGQSIYPALSEPVFIVVEISIHRVSYLVVVKCSNDHAPLGRITRKHPQTTHSGASHPRAWRGTRTRPSSAPSAAAPPRTRSSRCWWGRARARGPAGTFSRSWRMPSVEETTSNFDLF